MPAQAATKMTPMSATVLSATTCRICHTAVPAEAVECPRCGELVDPLSLEDEGPPELGEREPGLREKFLYYAGIALILLGGPGLALGSWMHDVLRISYLNYNSFDVFGPVNRLVLALGLIIMTLGIVFLVLSLRLTRPVGTEEPA